MWRLRTGEAVPRIGVEAEDGGTIEAEGGCRGKGWM